MRKFKLQTSEFPEPLKKKKSFAQGQAQFVYRNARWILAGIVLTTLAALPFAQRLKIRANFMELLPEKTASIVDLKELNGHVGGSSYLIAIIESPKEEAAKLAAASFATKVKALPGVGSVDRRTSFPAFETRKLLFLTLGSLTKLQQNVQEVIDYHRRKNNPFFIDLMEEAAPSIDLESLTLEEKVSRIGGFSSKSNGSFMQAILIKPTHPLSDFERSKELFTEIDTVFEEIKKEVDVGEVPLSVALTGPYKVRYDEYRTILRDLRVTGTLSAALIALIMIVGFRSIRSIFYIYAPLGVVILWTSAFASITFGYLNLISGFLFGILLGMGIDYAIHLRITLGHYYDETHDLSLAIEKTYADVGRPILTSSLTASIAFFSMAISSFEGFKHFGIIAGAGILFSFIVVIYGLPSLMVLGEKYSPAKNGKFHSTVEVKTSRTVMGGILLVCVLFSIYSFAQISGIKFDYNFANLQARDEGVKLAERVYDHFDVELTPAAFMTPNRARAIDLTAQINRYIKTHPGTSFDFAASIMSHIPRDQAEKIRVLAQIDDLIERRRALIPALAPDIREQIENLRNKLKPEELAVEDLPGGLHRQYEGREKNVSVVFVFPKEGILDGQVAKRFITELRGLPVASDITLAGEPVIYADILMLLEKDTPRSLALSFLMVIVVLFLHFRRAAHVFWVMLPVVTAFLWMIGMAGAANFKFNYLNVAILPSVLGAGIDNGIYIYHAYKNKRDRNIFDALRNTGKGVLLSSATAIAAFVSLLFARHAGMASMGMLGVFGFTSCFFTSVIFLPSLIQFVESRKRRVKLPVTTASRLSLPEDPARYTKHKSRYERIHPDISRDEASLYPQPSPRISE